MTYLRITYDAILVGIGNILKLLPTGTVFLYVFLSPLAAGKCTAAEKTLSAALVVLCTVFCCLACFTDSYLANGIRHYGIATTTGLWLWVPDTSEASERPNLEQYKLRPGDLLHAFLAVLVFAAVALLDSAAVRCFYPGASESGTDRRFFGFILTVFGGTSSLVFAVFPYKRHGIGYPPSKQLYI